jgi:hypothetical protein
MTNGKTLSDILATYRDKMRQAINAGHIERAREVQAKIDATLQLIEWKGARETFTQSDAAFILKAA